LPKRDRALYCTAIASDSGGCLVNHVNSGGQARAQASYTRNLDLRVSVGRDEVHAIGRSASRFTDNLEVRNKPVQRQLVLFERGPAPIGLALGHGDGFQNCLARALPGLSYGYGFLRQAVTEVPPERALRDNIGAAAEQAFEFVLRSPEIERRTSGLHSSPGSLESLA